MYVVCLSYLLIVITLIRQILIPMTTGRLFFLSSVSFAEKFLDRLLKSVLH